MNYYNNNNNHLPRSLPTEEAAYAAQSTTSTASIPYTEEIIAHAHRRNHSSDHIVFPKFPVPPPDSASSTTSAQGHNSTSTHPSEPQHAVINLQSRSSSMPSTVGHRLSTGKEKETYTLSDRTSTLLQVTGQIPPPLIGSTTIIHNKRMVLFGGRQEGGAPTNSLYVLDLDTLVWELVDLTYHQRHAAQQSDLATKSTSPSSREERHHPLSPDNTQRIDPFASFTSVGKLFITWMRADLESYMPGYRFDRHRTCLSERIRLDV